MVCSPIYDHVAQRAVEHPGKLARSGLCQYSMAAKGCPTASSWIESTVWVQSFAYRILDDREGNVDPDACRIHHYATQRNLEINVVVE